MNRRILLPAAYLPSISWFCALEQGACIIDTGEHFLKRSERNRARIMTSDGVMELSAQVVRANRPRQPMHAMRLDYSKRWQKQHWGALMAAYKASPYFDYYAPRLERFYDREYPSLVEFNLALIAELCAMLGLQMPPDTEQYIEAEADDLDLRPKQKEGPAFVTEPYIQVFADRQPYVGNLSVVDLLFNEGPAALGVLRRCRPAW